MTGLDGVFVWFPPTKYCVSVLLVNIVVVQCEYACVSSVIMLLLWIFLTMAT